MNNPLAFLIHRIKTQLNKLLAGGMLCFFLLALTPLQAYEFTQANRLKVHSRISS